MKRPSPDKGEAISKEPVQHSPSQLPRSPEKTPQDYDCDYAIRLSKRWLVEKLFGWPKQIGPLKKVKLRGLAKVDWLFVFSCAAFDLIRIPKLRAQSA
jgi:hypothetical protein